ncbi:hypothetical protein [Paenibacillus sp. J2TS4]|uniref:hypothetical protein n=1 Tax=Paenibacillus sp. J2TS4 TaxID=2807194 RepID=UPI001B1C479A|nr:hypothetical protein [Paenibacillus sp. J2TS4]GIP33780.1 hypothetical protein J2TS4_29900 [Paenibacillus sp. J2TS4]
MNKQKALQWGTKRQIGRAKFLINYCILGIGLSSAIGLTLLEFIVMHDIFWQFAVIRLLFFPVLSFLFGIAYWDSKERKYAEFINSTTTTTESPQR